jgi:predicted NBD/HSP70 family sugar kinase
MKIQKKALHHSELAGINRAVVLGLVRQYQPIARVEITRRSGLSPGTTSRIVSELLRQNLVLEHGVQNSTGGRPATHLRLSQSAPLAIGIDLHTEHTRFAVGTIGGSILQSEIVPTRSRPLKMLEMVVDWVAGYRRTHPGVHLEGIGVSARGLINSEAGIIEIGHDPTWQNVPLKAWLEERLQLPVFIENSVRAAAFAEYVFSGPEIRQSRCLLFVEVGEGVGFGIVLDGKVYHGPRWAAGEFGQMVIVDSGDVERHDRSGCLEKLTANLAVCQRYRSLSGAQDKGTHPDSAHQVRQICHLALEGDVAATRALTETCRYLGIGIANVVWGLDADAVIVDGPLTLAWPLVGPALQDLFPNGRLFSNFRNLVLRPSALCGDASVIGASMLPFASLFSSGWRARLAVRQVNESFVDSAEKKVLIGQS